MSDLAATNCGNGCSERSGGCGGNIIWILLLLSCCGNGNRSTFGSECGCGCGCDGGLFGGNDDNCCSLIWILLLLSCCGGNDHGCGSGLFGGNDGCGFGGGNCSCIIIILLLLCCCGNNGVSDRSNCGCGCGC